MAAVLNEPVKGKLKVVDTDTHFWQPVKLWEHLLSPTYREGVLNFLAEQDAKKKGNNTVKNMTEDASGKKYSDYGDKLSSGDKEKIQAAVDRLKKSKDSDRADEIKRAIDETNRTLHDFSKTLYEAAAKNASPGQAPPNGNGGGSHGSGSEDKVIDADFKTK